LTATHTFCYDIDVGFVTGIVTGNETGNGDQIARAGGCMSGNQRITIADIARMAGVSKQTVSRVINDKPDVAPQTRERIKVIIKSMGYSPDPIARSMKGSTHTLGCITPNLSDFNFSSIVQAAQTEARSHGFLIFSGSAPSEIDVLPLMNEMMARRVDGFLVINPRDDLRYRHFLPLIEAKVPVVYIKNSPHDEPVSAVCMDDFSGGLMATQYLASLGHTSIVTILGPENEECTRDRLGGYRKGLGGAGLQEDQRLIIQGDWTAESGKMAVKKLLDYQVDFTAIFAQNDRMALGAMQILREKGLRIPEDISVIGYDDLPLTAYFTPPLTTIRQPIKKFGQIGAQLLIETINKPGFKPKVVRLDPQLVIRQTCAPFQQKPYPK
jgi:DNA-binding LacI/PurR family transcriptional regulator